MGRAHDSDLDPTCCVLRGSQPLTGWHHLFLFFSLLLFSLTLAALGLRHGTVANAEIRSPIFRRILLFILLPIFRLAT